MKAGKLSSLIFLQHVKSLKGPAYDLVANTEDDNFHIASTHNITAFSLLENPRIQTCPVLMRLLGDDHHKV